MRLSLHVVDAAKKGFKKLLMHTVDTDEVVVYTGVNFRVLAIHEITAGIVPEKSATLTIFHAFTDYNTMSSFAGIGKKTALTWNVYPEVTEELVHIAGY